MGGRLLEGPTLVGRALDWRDELGRWLKPFVDRLGHKARRRMCPLYVSGLQMLLTLVPDPRGGPSATRTRTADSQTPAAMKWCKACAVPAANRRMTPARVTASATSGSTVAAPTRRHWIRTTSR